MILYQPTSRLGTTQWSFFLIVLNYWLCFVVAMILDLTHVVENIFHTP